MGQRKVVLRVETVMGKRIDVVDVELALVQDKVEFIVTDEATPRLPGEQSLFKLRATILVEPFEVGGASHV